MRARARSEQKEDLSEGGGADEAIGQEAPAGIGDQSPLYYDLRLLPSGLVKQFARK